MDGLVVPVLTIVAAAAVTFYAVSFNEIREKSFRALDDKDEENGKAGFQSSMSSRERRANRKANKKSNNSS
ncbi:unnamed protein product [Amaranthus hypochondriacus]